MTITSTIRAYPRLREAEELMRRGLTDQASVQVIQLVAFASE